MSWKLVFLYAIPAAEWHKLPSFSGTKPPMSAYHGINSMLWTTMYANTLSWPALPVPLSPTAGWKQLPLQWCSQALTAEQLTALQSCTMDLRATRSKSWHCSGCLHQVEVSLAGVLSLLGGASSDKIKQLLSPMELAAWETSTLTIKHNYILPYSHCYFNIYNADLELQLTLYPDLHCKTMHKTTICKAKEQQGFIGASALCKRSTICLSAAATTIDFPPSEGIKNEFRFHWAKAQPFISLACLS